MKLIYLLLIPLFCTLNIAAREKNLSKSVTTQADSISDDRVEYRFALGVQLGTDIGGAIPFPFSNVPDVFNPYPKLSPSIGAKLTFPVTRDVYKRQILFPQQAPSPLSTIHRE